MNSTSTCLYAFIVAALCLSSCGNDDSGTPTPTPTPNPNPQSQYYFTATIDGQQVSFQDGQNNYLMGTTIGVGQMNGTYPTALGLVLFRFQQPANTGTVLIVNNYPQHPTTSQLDMLWRTDTYTYSDSLNSTMGAKILYSDANGKEWSSYWGSGDQTGSTFTVTEVSPYNNSLTGKLSKTVKGTFSCKLYSRQGAVKTATNGTFRGVSQYEE